MNTRHYKALEQMYLLGPINKIFPPQIEISNGKATISMEVKPEYFHVLGAMHGSVYFKLLDDSAAFAAGSKNDQNPMVTVSFTTQISRPVSKGRVKATGNIVKLDGRKVYVESVMYDEDGNEIAKGNGIFLPAKIGLEEIEAYSQK
jgi:uncharacterized protein (TIGR00369 family)